MVGAGLLAKKAVERGLTTPPWVKTSLAPGSRAVTGYLDRAGLTPFLDELRFDLVGYGCTTCIGNSGPLAAPIDAGDRGERPRRGGGAVGQPQLRGPHPPARARQLPGLAAAGRGLRPRRPGGHRPHHRAARRGRGRRAGVPRRTSGRPRRRSPRRSASPVNRALFEESYATVFEGDERWRALPVPDGRDLRLGPRVAPTSSCRRSSRAITPEPAPVTDIVGARALAVLGDSITTDHISPAGHRSRPARPPGGTWSSTAWSRATSTASGRGAATTR